MLSLRDGFECARWVHTRVLNMHGWLENDVIWTSQLGGQPASYEPPRLQLFRVSSTAHKLQPARDRPSAAACARKRARRQQDSGHLHRVLPLSPARRVEMSSTRQR